MSSSSSFTSAASISTSTPPIDILGDGGHWKLGKATKLMFAAASGSLRTLEKVLRQGARVDVKNELGFTAMHFAAKAKNDNSDVIKELEHQGLSVNVRATGKWCEEMQTDDGFTPLHLVESAGSTATLIELGADPDDFGLALDGRERGTCTFFAAANNKAPVLKVLLDSGRALISGSYCWWAAKFGYVEVVKVFLDYGHFDLGFVREKKTIAQIVFETGTYNRRLRNKCNEIIKLLNEAGAPDEKPPDALGPVYGIPYKY